VSGRVKIVSPKNKGGILTNMSISCIVSLNCKEMTVRLLI
jgi:hypothetical protein